ncbi:MAG: hypothetical protein GXO32_05590 [Crenarchaeota archaeon]|nr:hypothetical protein [Thermoproteota archaeon]
MLTLTKRILRAWRSYGYEQAFVIGPQGSGKTTYAMLVAYEVYSHLKQWLKQKGFKDPWDAVLHYITFDPRELMDELHSALERGYRIPLIVFDDAGVHLSKYLIQQGGESYRLVMWLNALFNLIRTICAATIFTSPDMDVLKELRKKSWVVVEIMKSSKGPRYREAVVYTKRISASGKVYVSRKAVDIYSLDLVPQEVRARYEEKRRNAMKPVLEELKQMLLAT